MAIHNPDCLPKSYRHYLADLLQTMGVTDYPTQVTTLADVLKCSSSHARRILNGTRDLSGTRTGVELNKYAALAEFFSISSDEIILMEDEFKSNRGLRV